MHNAKKCWWNQVSIQVSSVVVVYKDGLKEWKFKLFPFSFQIKVKFSINDLTQENHNKNTKKT